MARMDAPPGRPWPDGHGLVHGHHRGGPMTIDARRGTENPPRWHLCDPAAFPPISPDRTSARIRRALCGVALSRFAATADPAGLDMCPDCLAKEV